MSYFSGTFPKKFWRSDDHRRSNKPEPWYNDFWDTVCFALRDGSNHPMFFGEDNSAIYLPIELKLSGMADFTIADVIYYVSCCLIT